MTLNLADVRRAKDEYTAKASDMARQLAFAGIAVIWLLKSGTTVDTIPGSVIPALGFFALTLACDVLHYSASSVVWIRYLKLLEKKNTAEKAQFNPPHWINWPGYTFFVAKLSAVFIGWLLLTIIVFGKLGVITTARTAPAQSVPAPAATNQKPPAPAQGHRVPPP
jgi:hypothetical protein